MNEDLLNISKWLIANKLIVNTTKTEFMLIGSRQKLNTITDSPVVSINGTAVNEVPTSKSLGVFIDANLTWGSHFEKLAKKFRLILQLFVLIDANLTWGSNIEKLAKKNSVLYCSYQTGEAICSPTQQHCILSTKP